MSVLSTGWTGRSRAQFEPPPAIQYRPHIGRHTVEQAHVVGWGLPVVRCLLGMVWMVDSLHADP